MCNENKGGQGTDHLDRYRLSDDDVVPVIYYVDNSLDQKKVDDRRAKATYIPVASKLVVF
jgi:hypothetical protein